MSNKSAIVIGGGGMNCAYSAGVLCCLAEVYGFRDAGILVGSSGSAGSLAYYATGQYGSIKNIWTNLLATKKFRSLARINKIMDLDHLVDEVFGKLDPLAASLLRESKSKVFISATNYETGEPKFFTNSDDVFQSLKASKAIPFISNKKVTVGGAKYVDGSISSTFSDNVAKAAKEGARNIIAINDDESFSFLTKMFWSTCAFFVNKNLKKAIRNYCKIKTAKVAMQDGVNYFFIKPSRKLKTSALDVNKDHLTDSFNLGYSDTAGNKELKTFIQNMVQ